MAKNGKPTRIEPTFDAPSRKKVNGEMRVTSADRAVVSGNKKRAPAKKQPKSGPARRTQTKKKQTRKRGGLIGFVGKSLYWCFVLGLWGAIGIAGIVGYYASKLPQSTSWAIPQRPPNATILASNGALIANRGVTGGAAMRLDEMSPYIPMAVIAVEDRRYKSHFGFDPIGFSRAMVRNIMAQRLVEGGSTITQQLAKNLFLEPSRTLERKVQELIIALWLERKYNKDEILELYLNRVYFGSGAYGVDAASRRYFSKSARDVNLAEAALLAGLLKAPSRLSPAKNPKLAEARAQIVLGTMRRANFITDREATTALTMQAKKAKRYWSGAEHYVADLVMKQLPDLIGEMKEDVIIDTTIDMTLQKQAGKVIADTISENGKKRNVGQGALVSMTPYGAVKALVGGREYADSQFNRATDAKRQPGSAFKPIVYLAALENGRTPESLRQDAPIKIGKWKPVNYDRKFRGPVTLDTALVKSLNTVAAQLVMEVGPGNVVKTAKRLGINSKLTANASIALGTSEVTLMELTGAYAPFANGGTSVSPYVIRRISDKNGNVLYERKSGTGDQVVNPRELGMMNTMLRHVITKGTGKNASLGKREAAGKTGTTQNSRDGLFVGYTANLVTGIWYGNDDGKSMKKVTGGSLPAQSWKTFMASAHDGVALTALPGNYQPVIASVPTPQPSQAVAPRNRQSDSSQPITEQTARTNNTPTRRTLSEIGDTPRPSANVGDAQPREKPRTILDLIFGG